MGTPRVLFFAVSIVLSALLFTAATAAAQCLFDSPTKARKFQTSLVRAMVPCPNPSSTFPPAGNTATESGTPACTPPLPYSNYKFGDKGSCSLKGKSRIENPCSNGTGVPCTNLLITVKCSGLRNPDGITPIDEDTATGWSLRFLNRTTVDDRGEPAGFSGHRGDMTVIDMPATGMLPPGKSGKLKGSISTDNGKCLIGHCPPKPSACTNIELRRIVLVDPQGNPFAVPGTSTR